MVNSRYPLFCATYSRRPTFSRSYGSILQSSFAWDLSNALVFSTHPPVSVYGTIKFTSSLSSFSCQYKIMKLTPSTLTQQIGDFSTHSHSCLGLSISYTKLSLSLCSPASLHKSGAGIFTSSPSTTPCGLALGSRLTLSGLTSPRKPWIVGGQDSHLSYATHVRICSCISSIHPHGYTSTVNTMLPYHENITTLIRSFGGVL